MLAPAPGDRGVPGSSPAGQGAPQIRNSSNLRHVEPPCDLQLRSSFCGPWSPATFLVRADLLGIWPQLNVSGLRPVLARGWHGEGLSMRNVGMAESLTRPPRSLDRGCLLKMVATRVPVAVLRCCTHQ